MYWLVNMIPEIPPSVDDAIRLIREDKRRGAVALCWDAAGVFIRAVQQCDCKSPRQMREVLAIIGQSLIFAQPAMAPLVNLTNEVVMIAKGCSTLESLEIAVSATCREFRERLSVSQLSVREQLIKLIPPKATVMTHSFSQTVFDALLGAESVSVVCTESRPMREGVEFARRYEQKCGLATLVPDAAIYSEMSDVDLVVIGADAVSIHGVLNKTGSSLLALAARERGIPFYVAAGSEKLLPAKYELPPRDMQPGSELVPEYIGNVYVINRYFELVPLPLLTGVVTETGILKGEELVQRLHALVLHPFFPRDE